MPKNVKQIRWRLQHTNVLKRVYALMSQHPFSSRNHFTITPIGPQVSHALLRIRFNNALTQAQTIYSVLYNYEVSEQGVNHIHGIMLHDKRVGLESYFKQQQLTLLSSSGGLNGWIKYMCKDKGKTYSKNRNAVPMENYL